MEIAKMSAAQLTKAMEKARAESSKITQMMIDAGRGYEYPSDMMKKSDPLSLKYQKSAGLLQDLHAEKNRRMTGQGNMRPIKYQENPTMATKKFSPAQIAAQKLFAERARAGTLKQRKKRKPNPGLYENINAKRKRIAAGSGEKMRKPGQAGRPTAEAFEQSAMTAKRNPDKSKPRAYVKRASQATGAPPSKRLLTRRKKALSAPAGYFPNPKTMQQYTVYHRGTSNIAGRVLASGPQAAKEKVAERLGIPTLTYLTAKKGGTGRNMNPIAAPMMTGYQVICMHPKKHVVGIFKTMAEAKMVATAMANAKGVAYGVKAVKVHKAHFAV